MDLEAPEYKIIHNPPCELFRAYDIRGKVSPTHLSENFYYSLGLALCKDNQTFIIARDGRLSSPTFFQALVTGLSHRSHIIDIGLVPSPMMYFAIHHLSIKNGLMITGSHNPFDENGIKLILNSIALKENAITDIKDTMSQLIATQPITTSFSQKNIEQPYIKAIMNSIKGPLRLKVVIDCGNGATGPIAPKVFKDLGAEVIELFTDIDGNFPNRPPDPSSSKNLEALKDKVLEHQADLGVAFDGDGDRLGAITNKGRAVPADLIMALFSQSILKNNPDKKIIFDIKCSQQLFDTIEHCKGIPIPWKTGHSHIKSKLKDENAALAGEMSGHIFFNDRWYGFDDGIYAACRLCELIQESPFTFDELYEPFSQTFLSEEIKINVDNELKFDIMKNIIDNYQPIKNTTINLIDGLRINFEHGWGVLRASNTSSCLTLRAEGQTQQDLKNILDYFFSLYKAHQK